jgi:hypothetical protein
MQLAKPDPAPGPPGPQLAKPDPDPGPPGPQRNAIGACRCLQGRERAIPNAAFTRCDRCSRLIMMSLRLRMPRTVGIKPTAVYG